MGWFNGALSSYYLVRTDTTLFLEDYSFLLAYDASALSFLGLVFHYYLSWPSFMFLWGAGWLVFAG